MEQIKYTKIYRIIHWAIAFSFILLLVTIFLRMTWLNKNNVAEIIQNYLNSIDINLSDDEAVKLAKKIRKPMWQWHIYIGYILTGLFIIRFMLASFGKMKFQSPFIKNLTLREKFKNWIYLLFYIFSIITLITGLIIVLGPKEMKHTMEAIHKPSIFYISAFFILHIAGVLISEFTNEKGIISKIISGNKAK